MCGIAAILMLLLAIPALLLLNFMVQYLEIGGKTLAEEPPFFLMILIALSIMAAPFSLLIVAEKRPFALRGLALSLINKKSWILRLFRLRDFPIYDFGVRCGCCMNCFPKAEQNEENEQNSEYKCIIHKKLLNIECNEFQPWRES